MKKIVSTVVLSLACAFSLSPARSFADNGNNLNWPNYGNDLANTRFQDVDQINRSNVGDLRVAWVFHTGVLDELAELQGSPIVVDGQLYVTDGHDNLFALDPATGGLVWSFLPLAIPGEMPPLHEISCCCTLQNK